MATDRKIERIGIEKETGRKVIQYSDGSIEYAVSSPTNEMPISPAPPEISLPSVSPAFRPYGGLITTPPSPESSIHPGAMIGGTLGEVVSIPFAPMAGPAAPIIPPLGAAGGAAIGEFISQATGPNPINLAEIKRQALMQGGGSIIGRGIGWGIQKGANLISGGETPAAARAWSYLTGKGLKQPLLPAEATENRVLDLLDNISSSSLIGGSAMQKYKAGRKLFMDNLADDILNAVGRNADPDDIGNLFLNIVDDNLKLNRVAANNMYNTVEDLLTPVSRRIFPKDILGTPLEGIGLAQLKTERIIRAPIKINRLKIFARKIERVSSQAPDISAEAMGDDIVKEILDMPDTVDFAVAKDLKTRLMKKIDFFDATDKKAPARGIAKKGISMLDDAIEYQLKNNHPGAYNMWREANKIWESTGEQFNNRFIRKMIRMTDPDLGGDPEVLVQNIFKSGRVGRIDRVKNALDIRTSQEGKALWNKMRSWVIHDSFKRATNKDGELIGSALEETLFGRTGLGDKVLNRTFSPDEMANIKEFSNALKMIQERTKEGTGKIFIQLSQAGAIMGIATGRMRKAAITILGGPYIFSRIFTNPAMGRRLIEGLKLGNNPKAFISVMSRLSAEVGGDILSPSGQMLPDIDYQSIPSTVRPGLQNLPSPIGVE